MVLKAELLLSVITLWFLVLSHFFRDGMGPFKAVQDYIKMTKSFNCWINLRI